MRPPKRLAEARDVAADAADGSEASTEGEPATEVMAGDPEHEPATEIMAPADPQPNRQEPTQPTERRFTAPSGFRRGLDAEDRHPARARPPR